MDVLLDTNFLLLPHTHKIDIFSDIKILVPQKHRLFTLSCVVDELEGIGAGAGGDATAAKVAQALIGDRGVEVVEAAGVCDDALVEYATSNEGTIVATNDRELKKRLKDAGVKTICLRGKNRLMLD